VTGKKEHDDKRLVRRLLNRDDAAFEEFFEAMYPALYRFALARLNGHREAAEDVAQTTLFRAIGKLKTYRGEASLLTWLCTFCRHEIFAYTKADRHVAKVVPIGDAPEIRAPLGSRGSWIGSVRRSFVDLLANAADVNSVAAISAYTFKAVSTLGRRHKVWGIAVGGFDRVDFNTNLGWQHLLWNRAFGVFSVSAATAAYRIDVRDRLLGDDDDRR
jgi:RNA polymerase sigma factor (sigma-70 family)